jgi:hypothetical protein
MRLEKSANLISAKGVSTMRHARSEATSPIRPESLRVFRLQPCPIRKPRCHHSHQEWRTRWKLWPATMLIKFLAGNVWSTYCFEFRRKQVKGICKMFWTVLLRWAGWGDHGPFFIVQHLWCLHHSSIPNALSGGDTDCYISKIIINPLIRHSLTII